MNAMLITKMVVMTIKRNMMQSEMADFAAGGDTWRTERNIRVVFDSGQFTPLLNLNLNKKIIDNIVVKTELLGEHVCTQNVDAFNVCVIGGT